MRRSGMGGGGSPMEGRGSFQYQSPQQRRSPGTFQPRSPGTSQPWSPGTSQSHANWVMTLEPAVHLPGGPFEPLPEHVLQRPFGDSPVRYRKSATEYEGAVFCQCGQKMARFISWGCFPGRRFYTCQAGCKLSEWYDPPFSQYVTNLFGDLRDRVLELRARVQALEEEVAEYNEEKQELQGTLVGLVNNLSVK